MGDFVIKCLPCIGNHDELDQRRKSRKIDKSIKREKCEIRRQMKILLLGAGESGKSTFLKQMRHIYGDDFDHSHILEFRKIIYSNVVKGTKVLCDARDKLTINWSNEDNVTNKEFVMACTNTNNLEPEEFSRYVEPCRALWQDEGIQEAFRRRREYQLGDSIKYFLANIDTLGQLDYLPTIQDILMARKATKGIIEKTIEIKGVPFLFVDVGGQRSQRQKWFQCFDGITSILFLVSSSEYDQVLMEDRKTNRLKESISMFETIVNNRFFVNVSIILFLNKTDLLQAKVKSTPIWDYFEDFKGNPSSLEEVQMFILKKFDLTRHEQKKPLFHHFTTAIDTNNIKYVFVAVRDTILNENLKSLMLQ